MTAPVRRAMRVRLWMKLAALAALGVVVMHAVHLVIGTRISSRALATEQELLGRSVARLLAREATEAVLVEDPIALWELTAGAVATDGVTYCFVVQAGRVLAASYGSVPQPAGVVEARKRADGVGPLVLVHAGNRYLDLAEPILDGQGGMLRIGLDMSVAQTARDRTALWLGLTALGMVAAGLVAAFWMGRRIARPVGRLLAAADRFDPSVTHVAVEVGSRDEIGELAARFNQMMKRLRTAQLEELRARQQQATTERLAALGVVVAGLAHEVNNPLAGLKNCLHRLERDDLPPEKRSEYRDLAREALARIERVMRDLLDFGRPRPLELAPATAQALLEEGTALVRPMLRARRIALTMPEGSDDGAPAPVHVDRGQIVQALLNLLLNAAYVTKDGGEIRVRRRDRDAWVGLAVEDDGPGIPEVLRARVLEPFFSTKAAGEGTGLGLSVTKSILDSHGGELELESSPAGTTVTLWLRRSDAADTTSLPT
ncbi:MAG: HAMP domain-containing histidine kinase [Myxococcales bacterium]|nr:HAMP domain-containing histidine kinase [Myxococcales bacterium]